MSIIHAIMSFLQLKKLVIWLVTFILISKLVHFNMFRYIKYCRNFDSSEDKNKQIHRQ